MKKLSFILLFVFLLRLPSLFEPAWYGDEGIYLVVGKVINQGGVLYKDIWDNKTPLLYFIYALNPVLWFAKLAATLFVLGSVVGIYKLAEKIRVSPTFAALSLGVLLSIPRFEGTIANGELFFILPVIWGAYLIFDNAKRLWLIGVLTATAFLIKVPAIFDFLGLGVFLLITRRQAKDPLVIGLGFSAPLVLVFAYFFANGAISDFVNAAFLQNSSYVAVDSGPLSQISNPLFVKGVLLFAVTFGFSFAYVKKYISKELLFLTLWFSFATFGALLSNRPYTHYLLQIMPSAVLLILYLVINVKKYVGVLVMFLIVIYGLNNQFRNSFRLNTYSYYKNFVEYKIKSKTWEDYVKFFDSNALRTAQEAKYVKDNTQPSDSIFVWDDAAFLYYLADRKPATKFIQAHHLTTVDPKNYAELVVKLQLDLPEIVVISNKTRFRFPELMKFIKTNYQKIKTLNDIDVYKINSH